jgi:hypothetical protein
MMVPTDPQITSAAGSVTASINSLTSATGSNRDAAAGDELHAQKPIAPAAITP